MLRLHFVLLALMISGLLIGSTLIGSGADARTASDDVFSRFLPVLDSYPSNYPHAPENISTIPGPTYIDIYWEPTHYDGGSPVTAVYIYNVGWDDDATPIVKLGPAARTYRVNNLYPGQSYMFFMRSENANGIGWWSGSDRSTVGRTVPTAPSSLHIWAGQSQANLSWEQPSWEGGKEVEAYRVYGGLNATNLTYIRTVDRYTRYFTASGLQIGPRYYYQVSAVNFFGEGERSETRSVRSNFAPRNFTITPNGFDDCDPHVVTMTWSHPSDNYSHVVAYRVYFGYGWVQSSSQSVVTVDRANNSLTMMDRGGWGPYSYSVTAVYDNGDEVFSNTAWIDAPMCEGYGYSNLPCGLFLLIVIIFALVVYYFMKGKKGRSKN